MQPTAVLNTGLTKQCLFEEGFLLKLFSVLNTGLTKQYLSEDRLFTETTDKKAFEILVNVPL